MEGVKEDNIRHPLPIGVSDYQRASTEYYYIDKTMMIKDILDERPMVSLFTRPRRFGKTLNMDMLRAFFEKTAEDTSVYFKDKKIWQCGERYRAYQGKYPVIFTTFKDVKHSTWEDTFQDLRSIFTKEFLRHSELENSTACNVVEKEYYQKIVTGTATELELMSALANLSQMLHRHHSVAPIIIIDEYDTPIQQGYVAGYYDKVILFMRNLFSSGLKDNKSLSFAFLAGILNVTKDSVFSELNNLKTNSVLDGKYSEYFGFTSEEVLQMADYYQAADCYDEVCRWYDGYRFGNVEIFNPWSVVNYFSNACEPCAFWLSTGSNNIIGEVLAQADEDIYERLSLLLQGESFLTYIDTGVIYPHIKNNPSSIYSFLLVAGYLKVVKAQPSFTGDFMCEVALPNQEISFVYRKEILEQLTNIVPQSSAIALQEAIYSGDANGLQKCLRLLLLQSVSYYDTAKENFYHGLMLGLIAMTDDRYYIQSNGESGDGRYDICLTPKQNDLPGVLIELKAEKEVSGEALKSLAQGAMRQINDRHYDTKLKEQGVRTILKYGVAFSGKNVEIVAE